MYNLTFVIEEIQTQPTVFKQYLYIMSNGTNRFVGKLIVGGFPDELTAVRTDVDAITPDVEFQKQFDKNKHELVRVSNSEYIHKVYDDDGQTLLIQWRITRVDDTTETREEI